jgi:cysteine-rich secretory family protein
MPLSLVFVLLFGIVLYWAITQVMPERKRASLLRPALADGVLSALNEQRVKKGMPMLEWDDELAAVAENKATHQLLTGRDEEGWDYPPAYSDMLGRSLLLEALFTGPLQKIIDGLPRQRDLATSDWVSCGIGVAGGQYDDRVVVALIVCREAWEAAAESRRGGLAESLDALEAL